MGVEYFCLNRSSFEIYENIIKDNKNSYLTIDMDTKHRLTAEQLKRLLLVTNVVIGAPLKEEEENETSKSFERQRIENATQQHKANKIRKQK